MELHLPVLISTPAHAIFVTEADIPEYKVYAVRKQCFDNDMRVLFGQSTSLSSNNDRRQGRRVAVLSHKDNVPVELQPDDDMEHLFLMDTGRWQEVLIPTNGPGGHIIVANIYGYPKTNAVKAVYLMNERILMYAIRRAASFPNTLILS